jgi:transmembrane 9 superfamily protein 2/4
METADNQVHFFAIINSFMATLFLCATVAVIMIRALRKDIAEYNLEEDELSVDESGWKQLHGDVFRPPISGRTLLSVVAGTGSQIGTSVLLTLLCAVLKILNSMKKGQILTAILALYVLSGSVAGYVSARLYKYFDGKSWKRTTLFTAAAFPGVIVTIFVILNVILSYRGASSAVSIWTMIQIFLLWVCVSAPLVLVGAILGYRSDKIQVPTKTNQISRIIPSQGSRFLRLPHSAVIGGILPFGSVVIELYFIMGALWLHQLYYIMSFILAVCLILTVNCATVSMVMCYLQLYYEDYRWWWKSFWNCAAAGFYLFVYAIWYLSSKLDLVGPLPILVYLCYMGMISFAFSLYCGTVGLLSSFWFCRKIYSAIKVD